MEQIEALSANNVHMSIQEMHDAHTRHGYNDRDAMKYGLQSLKWSGWGSPVGLGLFLLSIGGFIYLLHLAGLIK